MAEKKKKTTQKPQRKTVKKKPAGAGKKATGKDARRELLLAAAARVTPAGRRAAAAPAAADTVEQRMRLRVKAAALSAVGSLRQLAAGTRPAAVAGAAAGKKTTRATRTAPVTPRRRRAVPAPPAKRPLDQPVEIPQWAWAPPAKLDTRAVPLPGPEKKRRKKGSPRQRRADFIARQRASRRKSRRRTTVDADGIVAATGRRVADTVSARDRRGSRSRAKSVMGLWRRARSARAAVAAVKDAAPARRPAAVSAARPAKKTAVQRRPAAPRPARQQRAAASQRAAHRPQPVAAAKPPAPPQKKKIYLDYGPPLPERYHADWMFAMVRDPEWVHVYWEMSDGRLPALQRRYGTTAIKRGSWRLIGRDAGGKMRFSTGLTAGETGTWYCKVGARMTVRFLLVLRLPDGRAIEVLASNLVHTPRLWPSERTDAAWYVSEEKFVGRFISDYEPPYTSGQGRSFPGFAIPVPVNLPGSGRRAAAGPEEAPAPPEEEYHFPEFFWPDLPTSGKMGRAGEGGFYRRENLPTSGRMGRSGEGGFSRRENLPTSGRMGR